jgi:hypothetical protein
MARVPAAKKEKAPPPDPLAFVTEGRWQGCGRFFLQDHECERSLWYSARWASAKAPAAKQLAPDNRTLATIAAKSPPERLAGTAGDLLCGSCPHLAVCWLGTPLARNCRTCARVEVRGAWFCTLHGDTIEPDLQRVGCEAWVVAA